MRVGITLGFLCVGAWLLAIGPARAEVAYAPEIKVEGSSDKKLVAALEAASQLVALKGKPPATAAALRRRAEEDLPRLVHVMNAEGYWQAQGAFAIDEGQKPAKVAVTITPGPLFNLGKIDFALATGGPATVLVEAGPAAFGLEPGTPARSAAVAAANDKLVAAYAAQGHPFAKVTNRRAVVDVGTATMNVAFTVDPGPEMRFGPTTIAGLERVNRSFIERRVRWQEGARYDARIVEATRADIVQSGLFSSVRIGPGETPDASGEVPMNLELTEGAPRSVGAGVAYNTTLGAGGSVFWEHRNLFGNGESLRVAAGVAQKQLGLTTTFRRPDILGRGLDYLSTAEIIKQTTDAYDDRRGRIYNGVEERAWAPPWTFGGGLLFDRTILSKTDRPENYLLVGTPGYVRLDTSNNLLDPTTGTRNSLTVTPYHSLLGPSLNFVSSRLEGRAYKSVTEDDSLVLAGFAAVGSIFGAGLDVIPIDKRLFAGGTGSVRAYGYQKAGPLDSAARPIGGRSSLELGTELRYKITETIGVVPFVEGGNVYSATLPNRLSLFWGAGIGARYYTAIGPIRVDLAFPFEKRHADSPVQLLISIGQAF